MKLHFLSVTNMLLIACQAYHRLIPISYQNGQIVVMNGCDISVSVSEAWSDGGHSDCVAVLPPGGEFIINQDQKSEDIKFTSSDICQVDCPLQDPVELSYTFGDDWSTFNYDLKPISDDGAVAGRCLARAVTVQSNYPCLGSSGQYSTKTWAPWQASSNPSDALTCKDGTSLYVYLCPKSN